MCASQNNHVCLATTATSCQRIMMSSENVRLYLYIILESHNHNGATALIRSPVCGLCIEIASDLTGKFLVKPAGVKLCNDYLEQIKSRRYY